MISISRFCVVLAAAIGVQLFLIGAVMAAQITGTEVEALETVLSYFGFFAICLSATVFGFLRWYLKNQKINPVDLLMIEKIKKDGNLQPILDRLDEQDERIAKLLQVVMENRSDEPIGSGEQYLRSGD
ncbi:MAG: hypothetical protein ACR2QC_04030 [Gammaproteobacteria bacterium]